MRMKYPTIKITFEPLDKRTMIYLAIIIRMIPIPMSTANIGWISVTDFHA